MNVNVLLLNIDPSFVTSMENATYDDDGDGTVQITSEKLTSCNRCKVCSELSERPLE